MVMKTTIWVARDRSGELNFFKSEPKEYTGGTFYHKSILRIGEYLADKYKWVTYEMSPVELNISITKKKQTV